MCKDCGCSINSSHTHGHHHDHHHENPSLKEGKTIEVISKILSKNDEEAKHNRAHFNEANTLCINLMSSPGSGKTTLLESTIKALKNELKIAVIEGDLETNNDALRVKNAGALAYQITTGQSCHLDAFMVHEALHHLAIDDVDLLFIENVGNLVCPASYDLGEHLNVVLLSITEGSDKPQKYPVMFKKADIVLITKADLAHHFDFDIKEATRLIKELNPRADIITLDAKNGTNMELWYKVLKLKRSFLMCLSIPSEILEIDELNNALVQTLGVKRKVNLDLIDEPLKQGDYVLIHVGVAMEKIDKEAALESIKTYQEIVEKMNSGEIKSDEGDLGLNEFHR